MENKLWQARSAAGRAFPPAVAGDPQKTLLAFDFDGTLSPIVPRAQDARMLPAAGDALAQLTARGVVAAIISGRPVRTLLELMGEEGRAALGGATLFGHYGAERVDVATGRYTGPDPDPGVVLARGELEQLAAGFPGAIVEDKGLSVAVHFRGAQEADAAFVAAGDRAREIAARHGLTVEPGRLVWELRGPNVTKGDALRALVRELEPVNVAFAGDDLGDLTAFTALKATDAANTCAVVSGSPEVPQLQSRADVLCEGPPGVAQWLGHLNQELHSRAADQKTTPEGEPT